MDTALQQTEEPQVVKSTEEIVLPVDKKIKSYQTPLDLLTMAVQNNFDTEKLKGLMDLQERWEKNEAKKAFIVAMTEFKKNPPIIIKDMHVEFDTQKGKTSYNHASIGNVVASITMKGGGEFVKEIKNRADSELYYITEKNRNKIAKILQAKLCD